MYNNHDNYGWYEVGNTRYKNKIEALFAHTHNKLPIRWNYNDQIYDQFNWAQEPEQSLPELYAARAWNIRNKYDYLVLHFSGGSDSANILETFIDNNIHLDEVLIRGSFSQTNTQLTGQTLASEQYAECIAQALPLAKWAKDTHYPNLHINLVETTNSVVDYFKKNENWFENDFASLTPTQAIKTNFNKLCPHYDVMIEKGKTVCHIYGADKPRIYKEKNIFYTRWLDDNARQHSMLTDDSVPYYVEMFYWSPDSALLQIKQLHAVKNYIKKNNIPESVYDTTAGRAYENFIASIIYNRTIPLITEHLKDRSTSILRDSDFWFGKHTNNDAYTSWKKGVDYLAATLPKEWYDNENFYVNGIKKIWSKPRYLGS